MSWRILFISVFIDCHHVGALDKLDMLSFMFKRLCCLNSVVNRQGELCCIESAEQCGH